jgi:hypothetical protein
VYDIVASPCPDALAKRTQFADAAADHTQSGVVFTVNDPVPPLLGKVVGDVLTCT